MSSEISIETKNNERIVTIPELHAAQQYAYDRARRFTILNCGRRWGKGQYGLYLLIRALNEYPGIYWWVGLSWTSASVKRAWRLAIEWLKPFGCDYNKSEKEIYMDNGSQLWFRTAANPDSLAGEGIRGLVVDEYACMDSTIWFQYLRATLSDYAPPDGHSWNMEYSWALFTGTPRGEGWSADLWRLGQANQREDYISHQFPTSTNPYIPKSEIADAEDTMPQQLFEQEYLADILSGSGTVFRGIYDAAILKPAEIDHDRYWDIGLGVDWGKSNDFTVVTIFGRDSELNEEQVKQLYMERFNKISYSYQKRRLLDIVARWKPSRMKGEANAMGEALLDDLREEDCSIEPFYTTNQSKTKAVEDAALAIEKGDLLLLDDSTLKTEFISYQMIPLPSGAYRYTAPAGVHDDIVMSSIIGYSNYTAPKVGISWAW